MLMSVLTWFELLLADSIPVIQALKPFDNLKKKFYLKSYIDINAIHGKYKI